MTFLNRIIHLQECRRLARSRNATFICTRNRDAFDYYENGKFVTIYAELMLQKADRMIKRSEVLTWNDGKRLSSEEATRAWTALFAHFTARRIAWIDIDDQRVE